MRAFLAILFAALIAVYLLGAGYAFWLMITADGTEILYRLAIFFGLLALPVIPALVNVAWERPRLFLLAPVALAAVALTFGVHYSGSWVLRAVDAPDWAAAVFSFLYKGVLGGGILLAAFALGGVIVASARE